MKMTPYVIVFALGCLVGLAELISSFKRLPKKASSVGWSMILLLLNGSAGIAVYWLITALYPQADKGILTAVFVGLGLHTLIRTRFTIAKQVSPEEREADLSINLGWMYDQFQGFIKRELDFSLMVGKKSQLDALSAKFDLKDLYNTVRTIIYLRKTIDEPGKESLIKSLDDIMNDPSLDVRIMKVYLAQKLLDIAPDDYIDALLSTPPPQPPSVLVSPRDLSKLETKVCNLIKEQSLSEKEAEYLTAILDDVTLDKDYKAYILDKFLPSVPG